MKLFDKILSSIYTDRCPYCNTFINTKEIACKNCINDFPTFTATRFAKGGYYCYSPFLYEDKFKAAIKKMKFKNRPNYSKKFVYPLKTTLNKKLSKIEFDYIAYVPMHKKKLNSRGYNQAQLLAKDLSKITKIPWIKALKKIKDNKEQHKCSKKERAKNVEGVYDIVNKSKIKGANILLIDDIITTGSTLGECCKILKRNGAKEIYCLTLCANN